MNNVKQRQKRQLASGITLKAGCLFKSIRSESIHQNLPHQLLADWNGIVFFIGLNNNGVQIGVHDAVGPQGWNTEEFDPAVDMGQEPGAGFIDLVGVAAGEDFTDGGILF